MLSLVIGPLLLIYAWSTFVLAPYRHILGVITSALHMYTYSIFILQELFNSLSDLHGLQYTALLFFYVLSSFSLYLLIPAIVLYYEAQKSIRDTNSSDSSSFLVSSSNACGQYSSLLELKAPGGGVPPTTTTSMRSGRKQSDDGVDYEGEQSSYSFASSMNRHGTIARPRHPHPHHPHHPHAHSSSTEASTDSRYRQSLQSNDRNGLLYSYTSTQGSLSTTMDLNNYSSVHNSSSITTVGHHSYSQVEEECDTKSEDLEPEPHIAPLASIISSYTSIISNDNNISSINSINDDAIPSKRSMPQQLLKPPVDISTLRLDQFRKRGKQQQQYHSSTPPPAKKKMGGGGSSLYTLLEGPSITTTIQRALLDDDDNDDDDDDDRDNSRRDQLKSVGYSSLPEEDHLSLRDNDNNIITSAATNTSSALPTTSSSAATTSPARLLDDDLIKDSYTSSTVMMDSKELLPLLLSMGE